MPNSVKPTIDILLATYRSSRFLKEQLDSILAQTDSDWRLLVRDAASDDATGEILARYAADHPGKIVLLPPGKAAACRNFALLLEAAESDLMMFCDHDDVWLPHKVADSRARFEALAQENPPETPLLVFTDSNVVDAQLNLLHRSMLEYQKLDPVNGMTLNRILVQNVPSGNTMLFNRALKEIALPVPDGAVMHDHWLTLAAVAFGRVAFLDEPTLLYRQHQVNVYGAFRYSLSGFWGRFRQGRAKIRERFSLNVRQGAAFLKQYGDRLSPTQIELLTNFAAFDQMGFCAKRAFLLRYRVFKCGLIRNLGMFLML